MDKKIYKVFDYLEWRGDLDFDASPFNEVDAAILCLLSYLDFTGLVPKEFSGETFDIKKIESLYFGRALPSDLRIIDLLRACAKTKRFSKILPYGHISKLDGEEDCIQQSVGEEEEDILCRLAPAGGNGEAGHQGYSAADIGPEHPGTCLAHLGVGLIDHSTEEEVGDAVKNLGSGNQRTDNAHAQTDGIGQIDHHECGQQCVDAVACNVAGAVADLVVPFQIFLFLHGNSPFLFLNLITSIRG